MNMNTCRSPLGDRAKDPRQHDLHSKAAAVPASDQAGSQTKRCIQSTYSRREIQTILLWPCTQKGIDQQSLLRLHPLQICVQHLGASTHVYTYTGHGHHRATSPTRLQRHRTSCAESLFKRSKGSVLAVGLLLSQRHHPCW